MCFVPNTKNKPHINHENGNKFDNRAVNLTWVTPSENTSHAWSTGLSKVSERQKSKVTGENSCVCKISDKECSEIRAKYKKGDISQRKLGEFYGVSHRTIGDIVNFNSHKKPTPVLETH